jgi:hypothetical protein
MFLDCGFSLESGNPFQNRAKINKWPLFTTTMPLEETTQTTQKSRLQSILEKNSSGKGVTLEEYKEARKLILNPEYSDEKCCLCFNPMKKSIYDTRLCPAHAFYDLIRRK